MLYLIPSFLGGLALNISPCLLPVIALKVLNFIKISEGDHRKAITHSLLYSAGIIISFLVLGAGVAIFKLLGSDIVFGSWALTSVWFDGAMAAFLVGLGLQALGVFGSIGRWWNKGKNRAFKPSWPIWDKLSAIKKNAPFLHTFSFGLLTTAMGSACCGPLLGYAMGMALALSPGAILLAFLLSGIGMASPYLVLSLFPQWLKWVPKPGPWVKWVKIVTGITILLTAGWFAWLVL